MAYDAFVPCGCCEEGLAKPPPVPIRWDVTEGRWVSESGLDADEELVWRWQENACRHGRMRFTSERIGNISEMADLRAAAKQFGLQHLAEVLPTHNGGHVPLETLPLLLPELDVLEKAEPEQTFVEDVQGRNFWSMTGYEDSGVFFSKGVVCGFGVAGVFVWEEGQEVFRSQHFQQRRITDQTAEYVALDSDQRTENGVLIGGYTDSPPAELWVKVACRQEETLLWQAQTLRKLVLTALEVQKPLYWW